MLRGSGQRNVAALQRNRQLLTSEGNSIRGWYHGHEVLLRVALKRIGLASRAMTATQVIQLFDGLTFEWDDRAPPDNLRRGQFVAGWEDATVRGETTQVARSKG